MKTSWRPTATSTSTRQDFALGGQVWRTDGTAPGTVLLSSGASVLPRLYRSTSGNSILYTTYEGSQLTLWYSDGTPAGTRAVKNLDLDCAFASTKPVTAAANGIFVFAAGNDASGCELWKTDGTPAGTVLLKEFVAGGPYGGEPKGFTAAGNVVYFQAYSGTATGLWKTDGTAAGTVLVKETNADIEGLVAVGASVAFGTYGTFGSNGPGRLWKSDGTPQGTIVVREIGDEYPDHLVDAGGGRVFFVPQRGGWDPWVSDFTESGTFRLKDIWAGTRNSFPRQLRDVNGSLFFMASGDFGSDLWRSNGTEVGTARVTGAQGQGFATAYLIGSLGGTFYLAYQDQVHRVQGNLAMPFAPMDSFGFPQDSTSASARGLLLFAGGSPNSVELWKTDGTPSGTARVKDLNPGAFESGPSNFMAAGDRVYFLTYAPDGLWSSDGTEGGTVFLKANVDRVNKSMAVLGDKLVFATDDFNDAVLWVTDGTPAGTQPVKAVPRMEQFASAPGVAYFFSYGSQNLELWKTDGTPSGTVAIQAFPNRNLPQQVVATASGVFFIIADFQLNHEAWYSDGTPGGTRMLRRFGRERPDSAVRVGNLYYFAIFDPAYGTEVWKSDGTVAGTVLAGEVVPGPGESRARQLTVSGDKLYFVAQNEATGDEIFMYVFDGTPDAFAFTAANGVQPSVTVTSAAVTIAGLEIQVPVSVSGGQYSIGCNGKFTAEPGIIDAGQTVCVRHTSSPQGDTTTVTTLTVGDYSTSFSSKTLPSVLTNPRLFAAQQYRDFLGREGESAGLDFYEQLITSGAMTQRGLIEVFLASPEFQNGLPQMIRLYFAFFNRIPDYAGLMFQVDAYRSGAPIDGIALNFSLAPEFTNTYGSLTDEQYVDLVYQNVLGRPADAGGRAYYLERLGDGRLTRGSMMVGFSESAEFQQILDDEVYVIAVYVGMLRRTPEQAGLDFYVNLIEQGLPRNAIIEGFLASPEYRGRF